MMNVYKVSQQLVSRPLQDIPAAVFQQLDQLKRPVPRGHIAITVGSRGICNLPVIVKA